MRIGTTRWLTMGFAMVLTFAFSTTVAYGDYTPPSQGGSLLGEFASFVGDFGQWNTSQNNMPMQVLQMTPASDTPEAVFLLFWLWLQDGGAGNSSMGGASKSGQGSPNGSIVLGQSGNGSNAFANDPPGIGGKGGGSSLANGSPSLGNGGSGQGVGSPVSGVNASGSGGSPASPFADAPEPAGITLFAIGGIGLLMGQWVRRRRVVPV